MKKLFASFIVIYSALALVACGKSGGGGGNNVVTPPTCAVGTVWNGSACVTVNGGGNVVTGPTQFYDYNYYGNYTNYRGNLSIVNSGAYATFLKEALAVCDRNIWGIEAGLAKCSNWTSGSLMVSFSIDGSMRPAVRFEAYPAPNWYQYTLNLGINAGGVAFNPLVLTNNNTFSLINSSKGFEIRAQGSYFNGGGLRLIQIMVKEGTLAQNEFAYELYFPHNGVATKFATGKFRRY